MSKILTDEQVAANELFTKATKLRDESREHWRLANNHLKEMGSAIVEMNATFVELSEVLKRIIK